MSERKPARQSRVPTTRVGRLVRLGFTAGELAIGGLAEGVRRATGKKPEDAVNMFLTAANADRLARRLARNCTTSLSALASLPRSSVSWAKALSTVAAVLAKFGWVASLMHFLT